METSIREELIAEWHRNEKELLALRDLPVGKEDPAARETVLERRQDAIEFALGLHVAIAPDPLTDGSFQGS